LTKPLTKNLWVFGKNNPLSKIIKTQLKQYGIEFKKSGLTVNNINFQWENHSFIFTLDDYNSKDNQVTWVIANSKKSIPGLIRKLPHYGKYGYLVFKGDEPKNVAKGTWPSSNIGLSHTFEEGTYPLPSKESWIK
jgi:aminopeptidase N